MAEGDASHADPPPDGPEQEAPGGEQRPAPRRRPHPGRILRRSSTALVVLVLLFATASYFFDLGPRLGLTGPSPISEPNKVPPPAGLTLPESTTAVQVAGRSEPEEVDPAAVRRALAGLVHDKRLGPRGAVDVDQLSDGTPVFRHGVHLVTPASTMKLLTTTAALQVLGPGHRFTTSVVAGVKPDEIVLVGGGDPLLDAGPPKDPGEVYPARADLQTLAAAVSRSLQDIGRSTVRLRYDTSLFTGPEVDPHWPRTYIPQDVVSPISPLWVNEGRIGPDTEQRSADPAAFAARQFARDLGQHGITVAGRPRPGAAPAASTKPAQLGSVQSAPLAEIVEHILEVSDNEGAEVLARQVAVAEGLPASFAGGAEAVRQVLAGLGIDTSRDTMYDGSGLSRQDRIAPATLLAVLETDSRSGHGQLRPVITSLPVAGFTGSLAYRFQDAPPAGLGVVRAKTGTLTSVSGLAGVVTTRDGAVLDFVAIANGFKPKYTMWVRDRLDQIGSALARCRCATQTTPSTATP